MNRNRQQRRVRHTPHSTTAGLLLLSLVMAPSATLAATRTQAPSVSRQETKASRTYVLRARPGQFRALANSVAAAGGKATEGFTTVESLRTTLTPTQLATIKKTSSLLSATPNASVAPMVGVVGGAKESKMVDVVNAIGARQSWNAGFTGRDVTVVLIDSGMAPVKGLDPDRVMNGPDLSFDGSVLPFAGQGLDGFGHGTHMAGIIGGRDPGASLDDANAFIGVAPDVRIVNIKVGAADGATDVSQVIAAIDWSVQHRAKFNIKAINLSYGTTSTQDWKLDPLAWAAEVAWRNGITVVAATGNDGNASLTKNPAINPNILAVGSADLETATVSGFTNGGKRKSDVTAPGARIQSLRVPGSYLDDVHPAKVAGDRFLRGSGTSQATAVVTGAVALLAQEFPTATPDDIKLALMDTTTKLANGKAAGGMIDLPSARASLSATRAKGKNWNKVPPGLAKGDLGKRGTGSLNAARGQSVIIKKGQPVTGEVDAFGSPWNPITWASSSLSGSSWSTGRFNGSSWSGSSWSGSSWSGSSWSGSSWSGSSWSGSSWSGSSWSGSSWSGSSWSGKVWTGSSWSGSSWSGSSWSGSAYSTGDWSGQWDG